MGKVLEMMRHAFFMMFLALVACGGAANDPFVSAVRNGVARLGAPSTPPPSLEEQRAAVLQDVAAAGGTDPVLIVELPRQQAVASLVAAAENQGATTWLDANGVSIVTRGGIVIATRGLGNDVMASDVSGSRAAVASKSAGSDSYARTQRYLNGEGQLTSLNLRCSARRTSARLEETCTTPQTTITNWYQTKSGNTVASKQWLGPDLGYALLQRLR